MAKKSLFISVGIGALAIGAALPFMLTSCNSGGGSKPSNVEFSTEETVTLNRDNEIARFSLDWKPSDHSIECSDFTFTLDSGATTATVTPETTGDRPLKLTVTFANALSADDKGDLKFKYNDKTAKKTGEGKVTGINVKLSEPPAESWTASLDDDSKDFGNLSFGLETGDSITIEDYIGFDLALIDFVPKDEYKNTKFTITAKDTKSSTFEVSYIMTPPVSHIQIKSDKKFVEGDVVTLHFSDPAAVSWTLKLDGDSAKFGDLKFKTQTADSVTIDDYIGETMSITMTFIPADGYKETQFAITAIDREGGNVVVGDYVPPSGTYEEASFSIQKEEGFADDDVIILYFEIAHTITFYDSDGTTEVTTIQYTENNPTITFPENEDKEGNWYSAEYKEGLPYSPGESITLSEGEFKDYNFVWNDLFHVYFYNQVGDLEPVATREYTTKDGTISSPAHGGGSEGVWYNAELDMGVEMEHQITIPVDKRTKNYDFIWKANA